MGFNQIDEIYSPIDEENMGWWRAINVVTLYWHLHGVLETIPKP